MTDTPDDFAPDVFIHFRFSVRLIRLIENVLVPSYLKVKAEFMPADTATEHDIDRAFSKIKYWIDNIVSKSVVFSHENSHAITMFIDETGAKRPGNVIMLTPYDPSDDHLAALLQRKLTAISDRALVFGPIEIESDNLIGLTYLFVGDGVELLPSNLEWVGPRSYFDQPWWERSDGSTIDVTPPEDADLTKTPAWAFSLDFLDKPHQPVDSETGSVLRAEFRPKVIDGGKTDE